MNANSIESISVAVSQFHCRMRALNLSYAFILMNRLMAQNNFSKAPPRKVLPKSFMSIRYIIILLL